MEELWSFITIVRNKRILLQAEGLNNYNIINI